MLKSTIAEYFKLRYNNKGYIALISTVIIMAVVLLIAISVNLFSINESQIGLAQSQSSESYYLANACAEEALIRLKNNLSYLGSEMITIGTNQCQILALEGSGNTNRIIKAKSSLYNQVRKIKVKINQVNPQTVISLWEEVTDF